MARLGPSPTTNSDLIKLTSGDYEIFNNMTPSAFAGTSTFTPLLQETEIGTALYMRNRPIDSKRVPIALLSEVFARFEVNFHEGREATYGVKEFQATRELMVGLAHLHESEKELQMFVNKWLTRHFDVTLETRIGEKNKRAPDGHEAIETGQGTFLTFISSGKWSLGSGGDPIMEGMCYFREFYRQRAETFPQYGGCKPALLLAYAGTLPCYCRTVGLELTLANDRTGDLCLWSRHAQGWGSASETVNVAHDGGL
jgi:hypothetical protein